MSNQHTNPWTPDQEATLVRHYGTAGAKGVAVMIGRSHDSVRAKAMEFDLPPSPIKRNGPHRVNR